MAGTAIEKFTKGTLQGVERQIIDYQQRGEISLPPNYSPENAMKSAWLILQETKDRNSNPVLETCTRTSICNALMSMAVQGLNPDKKQCYFIAYGQQLTLSRSYLGAMEVARRVDESIDRIDADVVYSGDTFEYEKRHGRTIITHHGQKLENVKKDKICAAYCTVLYRDGSENTTIMTIDEIKQSWMQSQTKPVLENGALKDSSVHAKFTGEMAKKTVINRACKLIINSSDDHNLLVQMVQHQDELISRAEAAEEIAENANTQTIEVNFKDDEPSGTVNLQTGEFTPEPDAEGDPY